MSKPSVEQFRHLGLPNPGRLSLVGIDASGENWIQMAAWGGRSESSRNRKAVLVNDYVVETAPKDPSKPFGDPGISIYKTMISTSNFHVAGNGHHVEAIARNMEKQDVLDDVMRRWDNEGPGADFTSRIFSMIDFEEGEIYTGRISKFGMDPMRSKRLVINWPLNNGEGVFETTYMGDGSTEPFKGDPIEVNLPPTLDEAVKLVKASLDTTYVALAARSIHMDTGQRKYIVESLA